MSNSIIFDNTDGHLLMVELPSSTFSIRNETIERVMQFLAKHPDRSADVSEKVNAAISEVLDQEEYEEKIRAYWNGRKP